MTKILLAGAAALPLPTVAAADEIGRLLFAEAQNLTDEPTRQYQAGIHDRIVQNERYGRTFYGGASVTF